MSRRQPKIPRDQMSRYDPKNSGMVMLPPAMKFEAAQEHNSVTGCGVVGCPICMPERGPQGDVRLGGGGGGKDKPWYARRRGEAAQTATTTNTTSEGPKSMTGDQIRELTRLMREGQVTLRSDYSLFGALAEAAPPNTGSAESVEAREKRQAEEREQRERQKLEKAYNEAKEEVKEYLLETSHEVAWDDVIGNEAARAALIEAIEAPIRNAELYAHYGMKPLKGLLLWGPPGCGKTMFGKAAASVIGKLHGKKAMLLKINGPEIQTPYVGQTESIIRDIFKFARLYAKLNGHPLTIFIDEADAILPVRSRGSAPWQASNVATFLAEMDGLETSGAFVILATNRPEAIDAALLRDGRCDRKIKVERPTREAALHILRNSLSGAPLATDIDTIVAGAIDEFFGRKHVLATFDGKLNGHPHKLEFRLSNIVNGAMIAGLAQRAKGLAFRRDLASSERSGITPDDFKAAIEEVARENTGLDHSYALQEFLEAAGQTMAEIVTSGATVQ